MEFYELVKAGDKTVQDAIETSRKLIDIKRDVREAEDEKAAVIMKASRAAWAKVVVCERADATIRYIQLRPKEGVPPEDRTFGFDYSRTSDGLVVTRVVLEGASANCGLRHGDVIINIQGKHVKDLENDKIDTLIKDCLNVNGDLGLRIVRCPPGAMMPAAPALTTPPPRPRPSSSSSCSTTRSARATCSTCQWRSASPCSSSKASRASSSSRSRAACARCAYRPPRRRRPLRQHHHTSPPCPLHHHHHTPVGRCVIQE